MIEKGELQRRVAACNWYHKVPLPHGIITPGWAPLHEEAYMFPADLAGKRVLDVGAWDGFWTFKALANGAKEVVAIDDFSDATRAGKVRVPSWYGFDLCKSALGYLDSQCRREEMSVYDISESRLGRFDLVLCYGVIYHCRHPMLALDKLFAVDDGPILLESAVCNYHGTYRTPQIGNGYGEEIVAEFFPQDQYASNHTNWWCPTLKCLGAWVYAAGWTKEITGRVLTTTPSIVGYCRGFITGRRHEKEQQ